MDNISLPGIKINVIMGRHAGFLTAASALARRAGATPGVAHERDTKRARLAGQGYRVFLGLDTGADAAGIDLSKFRAQEDNLGRVVDPQQQQDDRPRRAKGRSRVAALKVEAQGVFADLKQQSGDRRANQDVPPGDLDIGNRLEDQGEQQHEDAEGDDEVQYPQQNLGFRHQELQWKNWKGFEN